MGAGKKKLERALSAFSDSKVSRPNLVPGALGGYIDGYQQIQVAYRPDFVYVRLRTTDSETIQAFNDKVGIHWDLPILVYRDPESPGVWRVYGRDIRAYDDWEGVAYSNPHAESHSFAGAAKTGADVVWTFKRQYMPLLMHPNPTGTLGVYIEPDFYVYQGQVRWWPGSGSTSLAGEKPTGAFTARFVTVYLNSAGVPAFLGGDEFSALDVPSDPSTYIRIPSTTQGVPLGAVLLLSGTEYIGWGEIYDLRLPNQAVFPISDVSGSLMFYDEATLQGSAPRLNVTGERLTVRVSGSYATINASPDPVEQIGVFNVIDPPGSALGTGTVIEWGDNLAVTISGTTVHVDATAGGGVAHVFPGGALVIPDRYPTMFTWTGSAADAHTINDAWEDILNLSGQFVLDNVSDVLFELMVVTSNTDSNWNHHYLRVVLDASALNPTVFHSEDTNKQNLEMAMTYHAVQKNVASGAHSIEAQWYTPANVNVNILNRRLTALAATGGLAYNSGTAAIGVLDEGIYLGAGNIFNFRGQNVEVTISGSAVDVFVTGSSGGGGHETGTLVVYDEGTFLGVFEEMRFLGAGVDAYNSGSYAAISIPGGGGVTVNSDGIMAWDEGIPLGTGSIINFRGPNVEASISGTVIDVYVSGSSGGGTPFAGVDQIGIFGLDEGVPLGTGTWVNFRGPNVEATISGTVIDVYVSGSSGGGGHETGTMVVYDENTFLGVFEEMRFIGGGVNAYNSGAYVVVSIPGGGGGGAVVGLCDATYLLAANAVPLDTYTGGFWQTPTYPYATGSLALFINGVAQRPGIAYSEQHPASGTFEILGDLPTGSLLVTVYGVPAACPIAENVIMGWDEGIPVGTGSVLNVTGDGASLSISGTVLELNVPGPFLQDDGAPLGYLSAIDFAGAGVTATLLGSQATITIPGGGGGAGGVDQIGIYGLDEGVPLGTGTWVNFRGPNVEATISGTVIDVYVSGSSGGGGHQTGTMVIYDEDVFLGVFEEMRFIGAGVQALNSGSYAAVSIPGGLVVSNDGVLVGTASTLDILGPDVGVTISGTVARIAFPGSYDPDWPPITGSSFNDEFNDGVIASEWSGSSSYDDAFRLDQTSGNHASESYYPGYLLLQDFTFKKALPIKSITQPFTIVTKVSFGYDANFNDSYAGLTLTGQAANTFFYLQFGYLNGVGMRTVYANGGGAAEGVNRMWPHATGFVYVMLTHDGAKNFSWFASTDGFTWSPIEINRALSAFTSVETFSISANGNGIVDGLGAFDFVRYWPQENVFRIGRYT
jgi:hypothetical protein